MSGHANTPTSTAGEGFRPFASMTDRNRNASGSSQSDTGGGGPSSSSHPKLTKVVDKDEVGKEKDINNSNRGREKQREGSSSLELNLPARCINPASEVNSRLDTQVEVRVYPCNNSQGSGKKKFTTFTIKPEVRASCFLSRPGHWLLVIGIENKNDNDNEFLSRGITDRGVYISANLLRNCFSFYFLLCSILGSNHSGFESKP